MYSTYEGGGYVAVMGYDEETAQGVLGETFGHGWVDRQTRAVILEFAVFNINTNLLSIATYFYEVIATGAAYTNRRVVHNGFRIRHVLPHLPVSFHGHGTLLPDHNAFSPLQTTTRIF